MKTKQTHTPGPWFASEGPVIYPFRELQIHGSSRDDGLKTASVPYLHGSRESFENAKSIARLIAAAPELLAGLKEAIERMESAMLEDDPQAAAQIEWTSLDNLREIVAKAEGKDDQSE